MSDELRKAAQDALEWFDWFRGKGKLPAPVTPWRLSKALRAALDKNANAAPETQPVASISVAQLSSMTQSLDVDKNQTGYHWRKGWNDALRQAMDYAMPVSTAPVAAPQREWQSLTPDEINNCAGAEIYSSTWAMAFAIGIEQTLRRKNT